MGGDEEEVVIVTSTFIKRFAILLIGLTVQPLFAGEDDLRPIFLDRTLAKIPARFTVGAPPLCSPDGGTAAATITDGKRWAVMINNVRGGWYDGIGDAAFAPDGKTIFYVAQQGKTEVLVKNHLPLSAKLPKTGGRAFDTIPILFDRIERFVIRNDSRTAAYVAVAGETAYVVIDNLAYPLGNNVSADLWFDSETGIVICETVDAISRPHIFINGKEDLRLCKHISGYSISLFFSKKGDVICVGKGERDDQGFLVVNNSRTEYDGVRAVNGSLKEVSFCARKESSIYRCVVDPSDLQLKESPIMELPEGSAEWTSDADGLNIAAVALDNGLQRLVLKGTAFNGKDRGFDLVQIDTLRMNAKAKKYAYAATSGNNVYAVVNNKSSGPWNTVFNIVIGDGGTVAFQTLKGEEWSVVVNGAQGPAFDEIKRLAIAPDGKTVHYIGRRGEKLFTVIGTKPTTTAGMDDAKLPVYSSDASAWAHRAQAEEKWFVVSKAAGAAAVKRGDFFSSVGLPAVSADGKVIAYAAHAVDGDRLVVNEKPVAAFEGIIYGPVISRDGSAVAVAVLQGNEIVWRVIDAAK